MYTFSSTKQKTVMVTSILFFVFTACSPRIEEGTHSFRIYEENGVTVAETTGGPKYEEELFEYTKIAELQEDEREESLLALPDRPSIDENGFVYVPEGRGSDIRIAVFNPNGVYQYDIGRAGQGPGEFQRPLIMHVGNGELEIWDMIQNRSTIFKTDGTFVDVKTVQGSTNMRFESCRRLEGDRFLAVSSRPDMMENWAVNRAQATVFSADWDTLWTVATEGIRGGKMVSENRGRVIIRYAASRPFNPRPQIIYSTSQGVLLTTGKEPVLDLYTINGDHRLRIKIDLPLEPVTAEDKREYEAPLIESIQTAEDERKTSLQNRLDTTEYPTHKAFWGSVYKGDIQVGQSGFIWIVIPDYHADGGSIDKGFIYRVLSPEGEYLGETRHPPGFTQIENGRLLVQQRDSETDAVTISVYQIRPVIAGMNYP